MEKDVFSNALQKFYSAMKNLKDFSINNDIIDNISSIDCFFSEFRNITFVMQKDFADRNIRSIYEKFCTEYLKSEDMRWFIDQRNKTTKQAPIKMQKSIILYIYMPNNRIVIESEKLKLNVEESFNLTKDYIEEFLIKEIGYVDIYFSTKLLFKENEEKIEIFPKIISGIETMLMFFKEMFTALDYTDYINNEIFKKIISIYDEIIINDSLFIHDYYTEDGKIKSVNSDLQFFLKGENRLRRINEFRVPVNKEIFGSKNDVKEIFERFEILHINLYKLSKEEIMPVFMILYKDFTIQLLPVYASQKTSIYRQVYDIIDNIQFQDVEAIFYCGEAYIYDINKFEKINNMEYKNRINMADTEFLCFYCIEQGGKIKTTNLIASELNDDKYVVEQIKKEEFSNENDVFFLKPIIEKMKKSLE